MTDSPTAGPRPIRRALLSVNDKTGLVPFARGLAAHGVALVSTGNTARTIAEAGLPVTEVAAVTGSPEMLDGRLRPCTRRYTGATLRGPTGPSPSRPCLTKACVHATP